jgi:predicted nucleic acid-binding protein
MPVVSNTSPILNLAIIGRLDLLRQQFSEVLIPPMVLQELKVDTELPGVERRGRGHSLSIAVKAHDSIDR